MKISTLLSKFIVLSLLVVVMVTTVNFTSVDAGQHKVSNSAETALFEKTVTITNKTTKVDIGFVTVQFIKNFVDEDMYPLTFEIKLYQEDGKIWIEFSPDVESFIKDVSIHVHAYEGFIYDVDQDDFVYVDVPNFIFKVPHFSRWCFIW